MTMQSTVCNYEHSLQFLPESSPITECTCEFLLDLCLTYVPSLSETPLFSCSALHFLIHENLVRCTSSIYLHYSKPAVMHMWRLQQHSESFLLCPYLSVLSPVGVASIHLTSFCLLSSLMPSLTALLLWKRPTDQSHSWNIYLLFALSANQI